MNNKELIERARSARELAYAPYSGFAVGAALLGKGGGLFIGANIENISYGLTNCAERVAVGNAAMQGEHEFVALALVSDSAEPVMPCGACRQVLAEFAPNLRIISATLSGKEAEHNLSELLPRPRQGILK